MILLKRNIEFGKLLKLPSKTELCHNLIVKYIHIRIFFYWVGDSDADSSRL